MIFITGPLYSGKRTFAQTLPGKRLSDVQVLAADAADLPALADMLKYSSISLSSLQASAVERPV